MFKLLKHNFNQSDEQLIASLALGNQLAFNEIYNRYKTRLLYYFYRMLGANEDKAQDFLQDIFIKLIDHAHNFDTSRKFSTWIFSIAYNMCKNEYRRLSNQNINSIENEITDESLDYYEYPENEPLDLELFTRDLFEELNQFDEIHKTVFILFYRENFSLKEISNILSISEGTVKSRLFYTRKRLAEKLYKYQIQNQ